MIGLGTGEVDVEPLFESGLAVVFTDREAFGDRVGFAISENLEGMAAAVRHLFTLGRKRIAMIAGPPHARPAADRSATDLPSPGSGSRNARSTWSRATTTTSPPTTPARACRH